MATQNLPLTDTREWRASAPGKVILCGEYSVLEGWPALVVAVNRRLQLRLERHSSAGLSLCCPGLNDTECALSWNEQSQLCVDEQSSTAMFVDLLNRMLDHAKAQSRFREILSKHADKNGMPGWQFVCDSRSLFDAGEKLGLGSSAAMTVAITGLIHEVLAERPSPFAQKSNEQLWLLTQELHSQAQGKRGSGVDLAASITGGVQRFINRQDQSCLIQSQPLPEGLNLRFIWTGASASTPRFLRAVSDWKTQHVNAFKSHMSALGESSSAVCQALCAEDFLLHMSSFVRALKTFDETLDLGVFSDVHAHMYRQAKEFGRVLYKPCGAGGGDLGLAISDDLDSLNTFVSKYAQGPHVRCLDLDVDPQGLISIAG